MSISRRIFLRRSATAAALGALPPATHGEPKPGDQLHVSRTSDRIHVKGGNGIAIDFILEGKWLRGIGAVSLRGKPLRDTSECIWPEIATPYGMEACAFELLEVREDEGAIFVTSRPWYRLIHRMEWTEHAMHALVNTASWTKQLVSPENSRFEWILREVNETHDGALYSGFSYGFRYDSPDHPIYQIEDKATWELGGQIAGNGFLMRGGNEPHTRFTKDNLLYSGWYFPGIPNPHVFQHKPLYTQMQGFTFQYDDQQVLLTVHERPSHIRSLFQRESGGAALLHFNQFCFDLTGKIATPPRKVLVADRKPGGETALCNHYLRVRDELQEQVRRHYGLRYDKSRPSAHIETWAIADLKSFKPIFEQLKDWGFNRAFIMPLWRSTETDINPRFSKDSARFGVFGNMCCPLELDIAECYRGWEGFRELMQQAEALNLETYMWYATHFSSMTPLLNTIPDLFCRDVNGQFNRNNYGHVLMAVNQRSPRYQEYLMEHLRKAKECGLKGVFHDSHFNLATDTINFLHIDYHKEGHAGLDQAGFRKPWDLRGTDQILSMHDTALDLQRRLQTEVGLFYYVESEGALGTPMAGPEYADIRGQEFIYSNMTAGLDEAAVKRFGDDVAMAWFRGMAVRLNYAFEVNPDRYPRPHAITGWWKPDVMAPLNHAYSRVEEHMNEMWVLENDNGIVWKDREIEVLFAYKDFIYEVSGSPEVLDAVANTSQSAEGHLAAKRMGIYLLKAV